MVNKVKSTLSGEKYTQFGKEILVTQIPFFYLETLFEIDELVQRKLDIRRRNAICDFILDTVKDGTFYFSPFIFSARGAIEANEENWTITPGSKLYIIDGQHRSAALSLAIQKLGMQKLELESQGTNDIEMKKIEMQIQRLRSYEISMQIYLDLDQREERQLFTDVNMERKDVHRGLIVKYDKRDEYSNLVREIAQELKGLFEIEETASRVTHTNSALTSLSTMRKCLIAMFEGHFQAKEGQAYYKNINPTKVKSTSLAFFKSWLELFPTEMNDRTKYVSGYTGVQLALANTVYLLTKTYKWTHLEAIQALKHLKSACSWTHEDPIFSPMYNEQMKRLSGLSNHSSLHYLTDTFMTLIKERRELLHASSHVN